MRHCTVWIVLERALKALHTLFMVERKAPLETKIEPPLSVGRSSGNCSTVRTKVEPIHMRSIAYVVTELGAKRRGRSGS